MKKGTPILLFAIIFGMVALFKFLSGDLDAAMDAGQSGLLLCILAKQWDDS